MTGNMVVALASTTADGHTRFGQQGRSGSGAVLRRVPGRAFAPGEKVRVQALELPQARQTCTVVGSQPADCWGFENGINEHRVAAGCVGLAPAHSGSTSGLRATDLVRLVLERSHTARQGVDLLTHLLEQHGPCSTESGPADHAFLLADARDAYAVETAGTHWVYQEVQQVRAVCASRVIRQDWDRISSGLAQEAIARGNWPDDGSKLDFAAALSVGRPRPAEALGRWGQITLVLEQQNGHIDTAVLRRLLGEHGDQGAPAASGSMMATQPASDRLFPTASLLAELSATPARLPVIWWALGPANCGMHLPLLLEGDLPPGLTELSSEALWQRLTLRWQDDSEQWALARDSLGRLQMRLDLEAEEFVLEGAALKQAGDLASLQRQAGLCMQHHVELLEEVLANLAAPRRATSNGPRRPIEDSVLILP